jgi:hypothetical protein
MITFKKFLLESQNNTLVRLGTIVIVSKVRSLHQKVLNTPDLENKINLVSQQNVYTSYLCGLLIADSINDKTLIQRFKNGAGK